MTHWDNVKTNNQKDLLVMVCQQKFLSSKSLLSAGRVISPLFFSVLGFKNALGGGQPLTSDEAGRANHSVILT